MPTAWCPICGGPLTSGSTVEDLCAACLLRPVAEPESEEDSTELRFTLAPGTMLGAFKVTGLLGRGGMATVYEAEDTRLSRQVALKTLPPEFLHDRTFARRFEREARVVASLEHPNIVPIYATGIDDGVPWMSMPVFTGGTVGDIVATGLPTRTDALRILRQVAVALDHAHARGVVHRDIKPTNFLLDSNGQVSVSDFGLARILDADASVTRTTLLAGTPQYMSPEQALGRPPDPRCDIYSLGIVAYEMFVGAAPFTAESPLGVLLKQVNDRIPDQSGDVVPRPIMRAIFKATAKNPDDRWPSALAFVDAMEQRGTRWWPPGRSSAAVAAAIGAIALAGWLLAWDRASDRAATLSPVAAAQLAERSAPAVSSPRSAADAEPVAPASSPAPAGGTDAEPVVTRTTPAPRRAPTRDVSSTGQPPSLTNGPAAEPVVPETRTGADVQTEHPAALSSIPPPPGRVMPNSEEPPPQTTMPVATDVVTAPVRLRTVRPEYPGIARAAQIEGDVVVEAVIGADGSVGDVTVLRSVHPLLDEAARSAVRRYEYAPGRRNGSPEQATVRIVVSFQLQ